MLKHSETSCFRSRIFFSAQALLFAITTSDPVKGNWERGTYYRVGIKGMSGSIAAVSIFNDEVRGMSSGPRIVNLVLGNESEHRLDVHPSPVNNQLFTDLKAPQGEYPPHHL